MQDEWKSVSVLPDLEPNAIQLWRIELSSDDDRLITQYRHYLSYEEQRRAERRLPGRVRAEFVVGRACLRILLANSLGLKPSHIELLESAFGKPELPMTIHGPSFNVSHSKGTILIALASQGAVGVDTEHIDPKTKIVELAPSVCTRNELSVLMSMAQDSRRLSFYHYWTRKEAVVKADGRGLSVPLTDFEVPPASGNNVIVLLPDTQKHYYLSDLALGEGIVGAVATDSPNCRRSLLNFPLSDARPILYKNKSTAMFGITVAI